MLYAHGFVNGSIFYPTYFWAFFHVLLSVFFLNLGMDLARGVPDVLPADAGEQFEFPFEYDDEQQAAPPVGQ